MSVQGYLVQIKGNPIVVMPDTNPVEKNGRKQFWFYHNGKALLASKGKNEIAFKVN